MDYDIVADYLELVDPNPDIWELFRRFDNQFFEETLQKHCVELDWSPRMTQTAGLCSWSPTTKFCNIKLSLPLLQLRSRRDLVETLIHEMIHGFLFVTRQDDNHESHGPKFHFHMCRINQMTGTNITVYHTFHNEVRNYQNHVWRCDGPCKHRHPFYGYVRRSMNRHPGPNDNWWQKHQANCDGTFQKIAEPDPKLKPKALARANKRVPSTTAKSSQTLTQKPSTSNSSSSSSIPTNIVGIVKKKPPEPTPNQKKISDYWSKLGPGRKLG